MIFTNFAQLVKKRKHHKNIISNTNDLIDNLIYRTNYGKI